MRIAIILATGWRPSMDVFDATHCAPLLPIGDRPVLQHVIERLAGSGIKRMLIVTSHLSDRVGELVGDGTRWGIEVSTHVTREPARPFGTVRVILAEPKLRSSDPLDPLHVILASGDTIPEFAADTDLADMAVGTWIDGDAAVPEALEADPLRERGGWLGWTVLRASDLKHVDDSTTLQEFPGTFRPANATTIQCPRLLSTRTHAGLLGANHGCIASQPPGLFLGGSQVEPGIWLSRNVMLHPTARLEGPVMIGPDCRIEPGVVLGPGVVIGAGCLIDSGSTLTNTVILPGSYVGIGLNLDGTVVDRNVLVNVGLGSALTVVDTFILGSLETRPVSHVLRRLGSRLAGLCLLLLLWPVLVIAWLAARSRGGGMRRAEVVALPSFADESAWRTFRLRTFAAHNGWRVAGANTVRGHFMRVFLPGLLNVVTGHLALTGVPPRSTEAVRLMPLDWRSLYLGGEAGLIDEALLLYGAPNDDEQYSADTFMAVASDPRFRRRLLRRYFRCLLSGKPELPPSAWPDLEPTDDDVPDADDLAGAPPAGATASDPRGSTHV